MDQLSSLLHQSRQPYSVLQYLELAHLLYPPHSLFQLSYQSLYHPSTPSLPSLSIFSFAPSRSILLTHFLHPSLPLSFCWPLPFSIGVYAYRPPGLTGHQLISPQLLPCRQHGWSLVFQMLCFCHFKIQPSSNHTERGSHTLSPHQRPHLMLLRWGWLLKRCPNHVDKLQVCNQQHKTENGSSTPPRGNTVQQQHSKQRIITCHKDGLDHSI